MGAPCSTRHGSAGTRWMQLGGARFGAGHGGGLAPVGSRVMVVVELQNSLAPLAD
jgi:hypothetical protein